MRRSQLRPGKKAIERGSTFDVRRDAATRRSGISPASDAQRAKVRYARSLVSGEGFCDPAHLWPRGRGGCDDPLCVVPLTREEHRAYDHGTLDLLPHLITHGCVLELQHALGHANGDLIGLLTLLTGTRWAPDPDKEAA